MTNVGRASIELDLDDRKLLAALRRTGQEADKRLLGALRGVETSLDRTDKGLQKVAKTGETTFGSRIGASIKKFTDGIDRAEGSLTKFGVTSRDVAVLLGAGLAGGIAFALRSGLLFIGEAIQAASDLEEAQGKANVVFGEGIDRVNAFAETAAESFGISRREALESSATFGNLFATLGFGQKAVTELSIGMTQLAADIASFNNVPVDQALVALRAGLVGETEPLRRLGVNLSAARLQQEAFTIGLIDAGAKLNAAGKAITTYAIVIQDAERAYGDFDRTSEGLANTTKRLQAEFENAKASLGENLLPLAIETTSFLADTAKAFGEFFDDPLSQVGGAFQDLADSFISAVHDFVFGSDEMNAAIDRAGEKGISLREALKEIQDEAGKTERFEQYEATIDRMAESAGFTAEQTDNLKRIILEEAEAAYEAGRANLNVDAALRKFQETLPPTEALINRLIDAHVRLARTIDDTVDSEFDASLRLERAREDALKRTEDAIRDRDKAIRDGARRREDANRKLVEAEEEAADAIEDSRERLAEVELQNFRDIRDAEERLRDVRLESAAKADEADRRYADARLKRLERITDAQLSLEEALFRGDVFAINQAQLELSRARRERGEKEAQIALLEAQEERLTRVQEAERDLAEARADASRALLEAEEDLAETIVDGRRRVEEAERNKTRVIEETAEREAEAKQRLHDVEVANSRALFDAQRNLEQVIERNNELLQDARDNVEELTGEFRDTGATVADVNRVIDALHKKIGEIPITPFTRLADEMERAAAAADRFTEDMRGPNALTGGKVNDGGISWENFLRGLKEFFNIGSERAMGGSVLMNHPYLVGERGPELYIPEQSGTIVSNDQLINALQAMSQSPRSNQSISIPVYEAVDALATANAVADRLVRGVTP